MDGYDSNGTRIYDSVNGKTCHQCRQKTMGKRTTCSECNSLVVRGRSTNACDAPPQCCTGSVLW